MDAAALQTQNDLLQQQVALLQQSLEAARTETTLLRQKLDTWHEGSSVRRASNWTQYNSNFFLRV